jgi:FkbM family methyltransferase
MARTRLPDGTSITCIVRSEAQVLAAHTRAYLSHGITLPEDAVVLDVGANVGVFAVEIALAYPAAVIHAFEPVPPIYEALSANAREHGEGRIKAHPFGVGDREAEFEFLYFPRCPALSSAHMDLWEASPDAFTEAVRGQLRASRSTLWYARLVPAFLSGFIARYLTGVSERFRCRVRPLAAVLDEEGVTHVDLLKIDCEGAELAVLQGVTEGHWPMIRQVVCEVMDVEGRLEACREILRARGFSHVDVEREPGLEGTPLVNLYARRG